MTNIEPLILLFDNLFKNNVLFIWNYGFRSYICTNYQCQTFKSFNMNKFSSESTPLNSNRMICMDMCMCYHLAFRKMCKI